MGALRRFDGFPLANDGARFIVELVSFEQRFQLSIGVRTKLDIRPGRRGRKEQLDTLFSDAVAAAAVHCACECICERSVIRRSRHTITNL
jgi:hypothetical protein